MGDFLRKIVVGGDKPSSSPQRPQTRPLRPIPIRPIPKGYLSFSPWHPPWENELGFPGSSTAIYNLNPQHRLINLNNVPSQMENKNIINNIVMNRTPNFNVRNNLIIGAGATPYEVPTMQPLNNDQAKAEMDSKRLNELLLNQTSAQRCRKRKGEEVASLENQLIFVEKEILMIWQEINGPKDCQRPSMIENLKYNLQAAISKREKLLQEVGRQMSSLNLCISNEQRAEKQVHKQARKMHISAPAQIKAQLNLNPSSSHGQFAHSNSNQVQNGDGTSRMQRDTISLQPPNLNQVWMANGDPKNQSHMLMANLGNGQSSTSKYGNILKSIPREN